MTDDVLTEIIEKREEIAKQHSMVDQVYNAYQEIENSDMVEPEVMHVTWYPEFGEATLKLTFKHNTGEDE